MASLNYDYWNALKQPSVLLLLFFTDPACEKLINLLWRITHVQHKSTYFIQSNITVESILVIVVKLHQDWAVPSEIMYRARKHKPHRERNERWEGQEKLTQP